MKIIRTLFVLFVSFLAIFCGANSASAVEAVASVKNIKGEVDVERNNATIAARTGLILHDKDLVHTYDESRVTLIFRDGSIIRLFPNTRFLIEKSEESSGGARRFLHNFRLKLGSFWGKFTRNYQETTIYAPTATVGIKGTTVALSARDDKLNVSLSTGKVQIANQTETIELQPGQLAKNITKQGSIKDKIENLPYQILIKPDQDRISIPNKDDVKELYFTLQLVDIRTNENAERSGEVYISIAVDHIVFDQDIQLNTRGYARVKATVRVPQKTTTQTDQVEIFALMDGEKYLDVKAGSTILTLDYPMDMNQKLKIDASSGEVKP